MTWENVSDAVSRNIPICTEKILSLTDHKVRKYYGALASTTSHGYLFLEKIDPRR